MEIKFPREIIADEMKAQKVRRYKVADELGINRETVGKYLSGKSRMPDFFVLHMMKKLNIIFVPVKINVNKLQKL